MYSTEQECRIAFRRRPALNQKYPHFRQFHYTAGDASQFVSLIKEKNREIKELEEPSASNRFSDAKIENTEKFFDDYDAVLNTFKYIFFKFKKGIFVRIRNNRVVLFLPFSNVNFRNEWSTLVKLPKEFPTVLQFAEHVALESKNNFYPDRFETDMSKWYSNNGFVKMDKNSEGDTTHPEIEDMFRELCKLRRVPDIDFFVNRRDSPIIHMHDGAVFEPYDNIFGDRVPVVSHRYDRYAPILSVCKQTGYSDIGMPNHEDWARIRRSEGFFFYDSMSKKFDLERTPWDERFRTAVFRGSSTGESTDPLENPRLRIALMNAEGRKTRFGDNYLNCGISSINNRPRKMKGSEYLSTLNVREIPVIGFMNATEQAKYKYLVHIEGHTNSGRLSFELSFGCCILLVESKFSNWFTGYLKPFEHFVPVRHDLSDLYERIDWCLDHESECKQMADNCSEFYEKYLQKDGILDYLQKTLHDILRNEISFNK